MPDSTEPLVYLVGAGPGDPGLVTLRAVECLAGADVVLHDKLVSSSVLDLAPPHAERFCIDRLGAEHVQRWPHVHEKMIEFARAGKVVVRLKGGDPLVFGRGAEEAEALRNAGIPYEIVPGVTAALAAGAYAEIPLTHRYRASAVAFITGHENPTKPESKLDWAALARFPGTLVMYMGMARVELIARVLMEHGKPPDTPAAVVQTASTGRQVTRTTTLAQLDRTVRGEGLMPPAIIFIGPVVDLRPGQSWFESRPLYGKRVLITRPRGQAAGMIRRLEQLGAVPYVLPAVEIRDPPSWAPVDDAIRRLGDYQCQRRGAVLHPALCPRPGPASTGRHSNRRHWPGHGGGATNSALETGRRSSELPLGGSLGRTQTGRHRPTGAIGARGSRPRTAARGACRGRSS
jgi:uroporphyrinogen III methyltransferase/synthase